MTNCPQMFPPSITQQALTHPVETPPPTHPTHTRTHARTHTGGCNPHKAAHQTHQTSSSDFSCHTNRAVNIARGHTPDLSPPVRVGSQHPHFASEVQCGYVSRARARLPHDSRADGDFPTASPCCRQCARARPGAGLAVNGWGT